LAVVALAWAVAGCRPVLSADVPAPRREPAEAWAEVLADVVTEDGAVRFDALEARRGPLDAYVAWLAVSEPPRERDNPQHAFWLNAYGALTLWTALQDELPARAAVDASVGVDAVAGWMPWTGSGFFFERAYVVQGMPTSLAEIAHERLRGRVMDPRDFAALPTLRRTGPPLRGELYRTRDLDAQLDDQLARWLASDRGLRWDGDVPLFHPIFSTYDEDFALWMVGDDPCTIAARFAEGELKDRLRAAARAGCPHGTFPEDGALDVGY
jgi:hypothetical protein